MPAVIRASWLGTFLVLAACELPPIDVNGLSCDERRPCGLGFECVENSCRLEGTVPDAGDGAAPDAGTDAGTLVVDAGPPVNLLPNPDVELADPDGGIAAWRVSGGTLLTFSDAGLDGGRAGQVTVNTDFSPALFSGTIGALPAGTTVCGALWTRGLTSATGLLLRFAETPDSGVSATSMGTNTTVGGTWTRLTTRYVSNGNGLISLRLTTVSSMLPAGRTWLFDQGSVFTVMEDGGCP
jgi:hypothetical protein